jgi:hypothetical protein
MNRSNVNALDAFALCILFSALAIINYENKFLFFRDYAIIWEGAYRVSLGQLPYTDFGMPLGPVSLIVPAIAFKIFGAAWRVLELTQLFLNGIILLICYSILKKISRHQFEILASLALATFLHLFFLVSPWYNSTALIFLLGTIRLALNEDGVSHALAGSCCALTILTKQDYGLMCLFGGLWVLAFVCPDCKTTTKKFRRMLSFFLGFASVFLFFFTVVNIDDFLYWFNYGQGKYEKRRISADIFFNPRFLLLCLIVHFYIKTREIFWAVSVLVVSASLIISYTSGLVFTSYFDIFLYPGIVYRALKDGDLSSAFMNALLGMVLLCMLPFWKFSIVLQLSLVLSFALISGVYVRGFSYFGGITILLITLSLSQPIGYFSQMLTTISKGLPGDAFFGWSPTPDVVASPKSLPIFSNTFAPKDTYDGISALKKVLQERHMHLNKIKVLNLSELTPLYAELGIIPQRGLPLWFHTSVTFPKKEQAKLLKDIKAGKYDLIIYQELHDVNSAVFMELYATIRESNLYEEANFSSFKSPSGAFLNCGVRDCSATNISVFMKSQ